MNKIYEIKLESIHRLALFQSGALPLKQLFTQKIFCVSQNEIRSLVEKKDPRSFLICFERNNVFILMSLNKDLYYEILEENKSLISATEKVPWKILKHVTVPGMVLSLAPLPTLLLSTFFMPEELKQFFLTESCQSNCAKTMGTLTYYAFTPLFLVLGIVFFYLVGSFFVEKIFKIKAHKSAFLAFPLLIFAILLVPDTYRALTTPRVQLVVSHWKNGTLNDETIAQLSLKSKKYRTAEARDSQTEE